MTFLLHPSVFLLQRPRHQLRASTSLSIARVWGNSDTTTRSDEPVVGDIPLMLTYAGLPLVIGNGAPPGGLAAMRDPTLAGRGDHRTWILVGSSLTLPASERSRYRGLMVATHLGAAVRQQVKLLGSNAQGLGWMLFSASFGWGHDVIDAPSYDNSLASTDSLGEDVSLTLPILGDLQIRSAFGLDQRILRRPEGPACVVVTPTGCISGQPIEDPPWALWSASLQVELSYLFVPEFGAALGYSTTGMLIGPTGRTTTPFGGPNALINASLVLSLDRLYLRFAGR
ncbi:hypothetical protein [Polyangium sp. 6x1]|uniref:hypothetical protein n=1 Tax=Polyangium sp. 6x1 TaxID=3042689 RepID=UPI00248303CF|nr:hypothetical protein [Polyangium sp. 6x1]MDI1446104.1 hypothetical protein [Polyangium sp. 6x1]